MNVILEGISAVGKTYIGKKLAEKWNMKFIEFLPSDDDWGNEVKLHQDVINMQMQDRAIIETSYIGSYVIKEFMYHEGTISMADLLECYSLDVSQVKPFIVVYISDTYANVIERRNRRGRDFEFNPNYDKPIQYRMDKYTQEQLPDRLLSYGVPTIFIDLSLLGEGQDVLEYIEEQVFEKLKKVKG